MRELAWYFEAGGWMMYPIFLLSLVSLTEAWAFPLVAALARKRVLTLVLGLLLLGLGVMLVAMGVFGFYQQLGMVESAIAQVHPRDAAAILAAGQAESRVCLIAGLGGALPALAAAAFTLPLASRKLEGKPARFLIGAALAALVLGAGVPTLLFQASKHSGEMAQAHLGDESR